MKLQELKEWTWGTTLFREEHSSEVECSASRHALEVTRWLPGDWVGRITSRVDVWIETSSASSRSKTC